MKIAVITDLHYAKEKNLACTARAGEKAKVLLAAAAVLKRLPMRHTDRLSMIIKNPLNCPFPAVFMMLPENGFC